MRADVRMRAVPLDALPNCFERFSQERSYEDDRDNCDGSSPLPRPGADHEWLARMHWKNGLS